MYSIPTEGGVNSEHLTQGKTRNPTQFPSSLNTAPQ